MYENKDKTSILGQHGNKMIVQKKIVTCNSISFRHKVSDTK